MAEIRLICPGCAAEYRVPDSAIPPAGREVECSACGKVWNATPRLDLADFQAPAPAEPPADLPRLNRPLPDSVLDILKGEVEHERRAREAEGGDASAVTAPRAAADPEWPATTITRHFDPKPSEAVTPAAADPAPLRPAPAQPVSLRPAALVAQDAKKPDTTPIPQHLPVRPAAPARRRGGYGAGFGVALMLAGGLVALYLLVPTLADQGPLGEGLMDLRTSLDQARLWLQDRAAILIR